MIIDKEHSMVLDISHRAGKLLLESGAEIARIEETMTRICNYFGVESESIYVVSNGIFLTAEDEKGGCYAKVEHIPLHQTRLDRVAAVNQLSREIEQGKFSLPEVERTLDDIQNMREKSRFLQTAAAGIGSGSFCILLGGRLREGACALLAGSLVYLFMMFVGGTRMSKVTGTIAGSFFTCCLCCFFQWVGPGVYLDYMVIGAIMPLIPGVAFTVAIRDIVNGDYISGFVRMMDALLVFFCIAGGVALGLSLYQWITGGVLL